MPDAVSLEAVSMTYGSGQRRIEALRDVSLAIPVGSIVALVGDNGAGKTTLLDLVCGLSSPTSGSVSCLGRPPEQAVRRGDVAALLQTGGLLPDVTIRETLTLIASLFGRRDRVEQALQRSGLEEIADRLVKNCSGGERQRVKFAAALLPQASLLVLDEPTAGMDIGTRRTFWESVRRRSLDGVTVLFSTHYADEVEMIGERVVVLNQGLIAADVSVEEIRRSTTRRIRASMGDPDATVSLLSRSGHVRNWTIRDAFVEVVVEREGSDEVAAALLSAGVVFDLVVEDASLLDALTALSDGAGR